MPSHSISAAGLQMLQRLEGFRAEPIHFSDGNWLVGYGHLRISEEGPSVTEAEAVETLALDLGPFERLINQTVAVPLGQGQFDALVSFAFSVGEEAFRKSAVLRRVNAGDYVAAACAMSAWRKSEITGELEISAALVHRRAAETALFLADSNIAPAPSRTVRAQLDHAASILGAPLTPKAKPVPQPAPELAMAEAAAPAKPNLGARLWNILKSEPATETLLLTDAIDLVPAADTDEEIEILTAHAKPKPRPLDRAWSNARHFPIWSKTNALISNLRFSHLFEHGGLIALLAFGAGLTALGASILTGGRGDAIEYLGAAALAAPGAAAMLLAVYGLWRGPTHRRA